MKNILLAVALVIGFSANAFAATVKFTACASYSKDNKVLINIQDDKLIDMTVYYLTEDGKPAQSLVKTKVTDSQVVPAATFTPEVNKFLAQYGVNDVVGGTSYAATSAASEEFVFSVLNQKASGQAVMISYSGNLVFIGSSLNCH